MVIYSDPVDVWHVDGVPKRFVWRGRLYTVASVLEHWETARDWWRDEPAGAVRAFWRVFATPGDESIMTELRHDTDSGEWLLSRVW